MVRFFPFLLFVLYSSAEIINDEVIFYENICTSLQKELKKTIFY